MHIIKCIRNNWLTEKTGELQFPYNGELHIANWNDLKELYKLECVKLSKLNKTSLNPKPIERQSVDTCLHVFCEETIVALKTHPGIYKDAVNGTISFLGKIVNFWKVVNVKGPGADLRFKDQLRGVIKSPDDPQLNVLLEMAKMADSMKPRGKRIKQLTRDTSDIIAHTCRGLVDFANHLLLEGTDFLDGLPQIQLKNLLGSYARVQVALIS